MVLFKWFHYTTCTQLQQLLDVILAAVLPSGRHHAGELTSYFNKKIIPRLTHGHLLHIALEGERIVGFAIFEKWDKHSYYLSDIAVLPNYQRKGIGRHLIFALFERERALKKLFLLAEEEDRAMQAFCQTIGFKPSSFRHPAYRRHFISYEYWHAKEKTENLKGLLERSKKSDFRPIR